MVCRTPARGPMPSSDPNATSARVVPSSFGLDLSIAVFERATRLASSLFPGAEASVILVHQGQVWRSRFADELPA